MDEWLDELGLYRKNNALDGTCLFRAVAEQLHPFDPISGHLTLRRRCVQYMRKNSGIFKDRVLAPFDEYLEEMSYSKTWAGPVELDAISLLYEVDFDVFHGPEPPLEVTRNGFKKVLMLCVTSNTFYDAVYHKSTVETFGFAQSIVYKLLYGNVFKIDDLDYAVEKMLHDKAARALRERYLNKQSISADDQGEDSYLELAEGPINVKQILDSGAILFPYKVAKALDPDMYRNIDFDNWVETNRVARRSNFWYGSAGTLRLGAKCYVRVEDRMLTGHIQKLSPDLGPVIVFLEETGQKRTVNFDDLIPMPRSSMKPEWNYSHKHQMISKMGKKKGDDTDPTRRKLRTVKNKLYPSDRDDHVKDVNTTTQESDSTLSTSCSLITSSPQSTKCLVFTPNNESCIINKSATSSSKADYSDLPLDDLETLRFYYNLGIQYFKQGVFSLGSPLPVVMSPEDRMWSGMVQTSPQLVQGSPLIQTSPLPVSPPGHIQVCQGTPLVASIPPPTAVVPPIVIPPPPVPAVNNTSTPSSQPLLQETPHREVRERPRYSKFNKPPRFQRLESAEAKGNMDSQVVIEEIPPPEVSCSTPILPECSTITYAIPPPPMFQPMVSYYYTTEPESSQESTYFEAYTDGSIYPECSPYMESEMSYQVPYPVYPPVQMYYP